MATNKYINARLQHKHDIEANWIKAKNFIPLSGEIIIYDRDDIFPYERFKIGDGTTNVNELSFVTEIDWNAAEGEPGHVLNRTHWDDRTQYVNVIVGTYDYITITASDSVFNGYKGSTELDNTLKLRHNQEVVLTVDGTSYDALVYAVSDGYAFVPSDFTTDNPNMFFDNNKFCITIEGTRLELNHIDNGGHSIIISGGSIHKLPVKFLPEGVPYAIGGDEPTDTLTFDGDLANKQAIQINTGTFGINIYNEYVDASELLGGTVKITSFTGESESYPITEDIIMDAANMGIDGYIIADAILVARNNFILSGVSVPKGITVICAPGQMYVSEIKASANIFTIEEIRKLDNRCLDLEWLPITKFDKGIEVIPEQTKNNGVLKYPDVPENNEYLRSQFGSKKQFIVTVDGKETIVTPNVNIMAENEAMYLLSTAEVNISFYYKYAPASSSSPYIDCMLTAKFMDEGAHTVSVHAAEITHDKLPVKFLPNSVPYAEEITLLEETDAVEADDPSFGKIWEIYKAPNLTVGDLCTIIYNGVSYDCTCASISVPNMDFPADTVVVGNLAAVGGANTGEPFVMTIVPSRSYIAALDLAGVTSVRVGINAQVINKIDPRCIDFGFDWIPNLDAIKGKEVFAERSATRGLYGYSFSSNSPYYFTPNGYYLIEWNHKPYVAKYEVAEEKEYQSLYGTFTTKDFIISNRYDGAEAYGSRIRLDCTSLTEVLPEITLAIYELDTNNKLPNAFLNLDWLPTYEERKHIISQISTYSTAPSLDHDDIYKLRVYGRFILTKGSKYKMSWGNEFYEVLGREVLYNNKKWDCVGNLNLLNSENEDTKEPFLLIKDPDDFITGEVYVFMRTQALPTPLPNIYDNETIYNKIPKEFLPEGYPYISEGVVLPETTFEVAYEDGIPFGQGMIVDKFALEKDCEYKVTWNDITYNCIGTEVELSGISLVTLGDIEKDPNTDSLSYPFGIVNTNDEMAAAVGAYGMIYVYDSSAEVTLSINGSTIHKIDSRFIPDLGVVTNIVNGEHIGSIRGISASQNNDEYQIGPFAAAFGLDTKASGECSHAEGFDTIASGNQSHAEGYDTEAKGEASHAEGGGTEAVGNSSHAEGSITIANGFASHAEGYGTTASGDYSHAQGKNNIDDDTLAHIVGNGSLHKRSNAHTLDWDGNAWFAGNVYVGSTSGTNKDEGSKKLITTEEMEKKPGKVVTGETFIIDSISRVAGKDAEVFNGINNIAIGVCSHAEGNGTTAFGYYSHAEGHNTTASDNASHAEGNETTASGYASHAEGGNTIASETYSHAEGLDTEASGYQSHAEGFNTTASGESSHAEGSNTIASEFQSHAEGNGTTASGSYSHAEGYNTTASGVSSHAEGYMTIASDSTSHAEGRETTASGNYSHAEGYNTTASGSSSHAEGDGTTASGYYSHAEGHNTTATGDCSHVQGRYNVEDVNEQYAHIVGNGVYNKRSNAHTLDWDGNAWFAGDVYVGSTSGTDKDIGSKKLATEEYVDTKVAGMVDSAPDTLNTLNELAAALGDDPNFATTIATQIGGKVDKVSGKGLSTNDYTDAEKAKLANTNIAYGTCSTAADVAEKVVVLNNNTNWTLKNGSIIMVKFDVSNSAEGVTINVNGTGAYPIWYNASEYTSNATAYTGYANRTITYMFNGTHYVWITSSYDANSTYTNAALGQGYATCSTAAATTAKVGSLSSYKLVTGGIVSVKFTNAVPANATLNINSTGAKNIYYNGAKITADIIKAGDVATFVYSSYYRLISINRWQSDISTLQTQVGDLSSNMLDTAAVNALIDEKLGVIENGSY